MSVQDVGFDECVLTIRREADGALRPYIGDKRVPGCVYLEAKSTGENSVVSMLFESSKLHFDTAKMENTN